MTISPARRWLLFTLVLLAGILNIVDRQVIAVLKPVISEDLGWTDDDYGTLAAWFQGAAAVAFLVTGWIVDRLGVKWANPLGVIAWSIAAMAHGWARGMGEFIMARVALGATEAMGTPGGVKTIAAIFPQHLRSLAFGLSNAVGSMGGVLGPLAIPVVAAFYGWRQAFFIAGFLGFVWALAWMLTSWRVRFDEPSRDASATAPAAAPHDGSILRDRRTWAVAGAKTLSDATWWLLLFWMPDFFHREFGLSGTALGPPLAFAYCGAAVGAIIAGWTASRALAAGHTPNRVHKGTMLVSALLVLPIPFALTAESPWSATAIFAVALAGHQGFSTALFGMIAEVTPSARIGRVTSFGAFCGNLGGMVIVKVAGLTLVAGLGYLPLLLFASMAYLLALGWIRLLLPAIEGAHRPLSVTIAAARR